ncbi:hypothetical protein EB796_004064 [Bugula neritina]|uniref:Amine oxidase domain-containing protein n=1 Tax=Bugula neritina TaxID=10212 RepID=A0A7J7KGB1_BUGNE|nr:hypothetical protein EB796_004064 [Bugula neritina]
MAAFTFRYTEVFKGLNQFKYERFKPSAGEIAAGLLPSQKLVDYVQDQLCRVFSLKNIPNPVSAAVKIWDQSSISAGSISQIGVDAYQLQFKTLKPFPEAHIYIAGDVFFSSTKTDGSFYGWSESSLISSERILVNHFGLQKFCTSVNLENELPEN